MALLQTECGYFCNSICCVLILLGDHVFMKLLSWLNQPSVMAAGGLWLTQLHGAYGWEKPAVCSRQRGMNWWRRKGKTQGVERASSIPVILNPNFRLSKVPKGVRIRNRSLQPSTIVQESTINLPKTLGLWGMSHRVSRWCTLMLLPDYRNE